MHSQYLYNGPPDAHHIFLLAHGAGAPMDTPWMTTLEEGIGAAGIRVVRFEFPYMRERRVSGKKRPPNTASILEETWAQVVSAHVIEGHRLFLGGKSMGGRMAVRVIASDFASTPLHRLPAQRLGGVVALGYPFHPRGKPDKLRTAPLTAIACPTLIVQGTRDPMGTRDEVEGYTLSESVEIQWLEDGDHSFKPRKRSGYTLEGHLQKAIDRVRRFIQRPSA